MLRNKLLTTWAINDGCLHLVLAYWPIENKQKSREVYFGNCNNPNCVRRWLPVELYATDSIFLRRLFKIISYTQKIYTYSMSDTPKENNFFFYI